jgi:2-(1,2-epoxy-1,2-dihydrophenyl)acetyl-CoA isomerase
MTLDVTTKDGVATLTLNRPERLNALTPVMVEDLLNALSGISIDPQARCVVLAGAGRGFCAGFDLSGDGEEPGREWRPDDAAARMMLHAQIPILLRRMPKPTIAAIRGPAAGSGMLLAAACDLRIASRTARFKLAFATVGRCGDPGGSYLLIQLLGSARAREMFMLDEPIDAERALALGLVGRLVDDDLLEQETTALASRLASGPTAAFASIKRNLNAAETGALEETMAMEAAANAQLSLSHDGKEAARAFMEKRPPAFRGY